MKENWILFHSSPLPEGHKYLELFKTLLSDTERKVKYYIKKLLDSRHLIRRNQLKSWRKDQKNSGLFKDIRPIRSSCLANSRTGRLRGANLPIPFRLVGLPLKRTNADLLTGPSVNVHRCNVAISPGALHPLQDTAFLSFRQRLLSLGVLVNDARTLAGDETCHPRLDSVISSRAHVSPLAPTSFPTSTRYSSGEHQRIPGTNLSNLMELLQKGKWSVSSWRSCFSCTLKESEFLQRPYLYDK